MIGLDTNVLARYCIDDETDAVAQRQRLAARRLIALTMQVEAVNRVQTNQPGVDGLLCMLTAELAGSALRKSTALWVTSVKSPATMCSMCFQSLVPAKPRSRTQVEWT